MLRNRKIIFELSSIPFLSGSLGHISGGGRCDMEVLSPSDGGDTYDGKKIIKSIQE